MRPTIVGILFSLLPAAPIWANSKVTATVDDSFVVSPIGEKVVKKGQAFYPLVTMHKILNVNGKTYVCSGHLSLGARKEFFNSTRIISSSGDVIKSGLRKSYFLGNAPKMTAARRAAIKNKALLVVGHRIADAKWAYGTTIACERSRKAWKSNFGDGKSRYVMPKTLWLPKY
ncbi:MAG: hypothetical protein ACI9PY_002501 [Ascidiaceihabitans sp.]|jgi:hypothetical protein